MLRPWLIGLLGSAQIVVGAQAGALVFESRAFKVHLLELFTSEGCSSCPPAEAWMTQLKQSPGLWVEFVPVAFHVDYWDHLGWRDPFAAKEWTVRQQTYVTRWKTDSVYTPGFVLDGNEWRTPQPPRKSQELVGNLRLRVLGDDVFVTFEPTKKEARGYDIYLARLGFALTSEVNAGENRGRKLAHDFVVLSLQKATLPTNGNELKIPIDKASDRNNGALVVWSTYSGDPTPIQATGGRWPL
ncbi:MAG: hypothetical protein JWO45_1218 [Spartobacteria bacterium]|nr:hypothetical protein [Spartobacteria bacterium]